MSICQLFVLLLKPVLSFSLCLWLGIFSIDHLVEISAFPPSDHYGNWLFHPWVTAAGLTLAGCGFLSAFEMLCQCIADRLGYCQTPNWVPAIKEGDDNVRTVRFNSNSDSHDSDNVYVDWKCCDDDLTVGELYCSDNESDDFDYSDSNDTGHGATELESGISDSRGVDPDGFALTTTKTTTTTITRTTATTTNFKGTAEQKEKQKIYTDSIDAPVPCKLSLTLSPTKE